MQQFLESLRSDGLRLAEVVSGGPADATVRACPGWSLTDLGEHIGRIHRWVMVAVQTREAPQSGALEKPPGSTSEALGAWIADGVTRLVELLGRQDPDAPTWHPFPAPPVVAVWPRRQAQETMIHRWDAEDAVGATTPLDPMIAADGVLEYFQLIVPRVVSRDERAAPKGVLRIECADVGMTCTVSSGRTVDVDLGDGVASASDAVIRADAQDVLLALWKRRPLPADALAGSSLAAEWLEFGGN